MSRTPYELTFWGGAPRGIRYKRDHATLAEAQAEAHRVLAKIENRAAHTAVIYGPGNEQYSVL